MSPRFGSRGPYRPGGRRPGGPPRNRPPQGEDRRGRAAVQQRRENVPVTLPSRLTVKELADQIKLDQLFLLPEHQCNGIGTALVREILERARHLKVPVRLRVLRVNPAKRLYERMGFFVTAEEPQRFYMQSAA